MVAEIGPQQLVEMFEVMSELEATCSRLAARRMTPVEQAALLAQLAQAQSSDELAAAVDGLDPEIGLSTPDVLRGRDMLCFSHDWSGDPLSKTHLMRLLARDNRVLWVNSIGYRAPNWEASYALPMTSIST